MKMITLPLGALETNCYVVYDEASKACALVDPGAMPQTILDTLEKNELAVQENGRWHLTPRGFMLSNPILVKLFEEQQKSKPLAQKK